MALPCFSADDPQVVLMQMAQRLKRVDTQNASWQNSAGRILAENILTDRDSPPIDVSAMDGYACTLMDLQSQMIPVRGTITAGSPPLDLPEHGCFQIFTGGPVPPQAACVIRREDVDEQPGFITLKINPKDIPPGANIRRRGENATTGCLVVSAGNILNAAAMAGVAAFQSENLSIYKAVKISIVVTGDELVAPGSPAQAWQIRNSNGPTLLGLFSGKPWLTIQRCVQVADNLPDISSAIKQSILDSDAVILTGGVSMGDTDFVPEAVQQNGCEIVFHRLPIRPGKPVLGAIGPDGQLLMGLPGNPMSVAVTARRLALPLLRKMAGIENWQENPIKMPLVSSDEKTLKLRWFRPVQRHGHGFLSLLENKGSGDLVSLSQSDGFVEIPAGQTGIGPWNFWPW